MVYKNKVSILCFFRYQIEKTVVKDILAPLSFKLTLIPPLSAFPIPSLLLDGVAKKKKELRSEMELGGQTSKKYISYFRM